MSYIIVGAGMAGLLAAAMLREECEIIYERAPSLPNNHNALLRFRSGIVGNTLGIPFKRVSMMKATVPSASTPVGDAIAYSIKTNGRASLRSSISANGEIEERYIAPSNLIDIMARKVTAKFSFGSAFGFSAPERDGAKVISTIPMPFLADALGYQFEDGVVFESRPGYVIKATLQNCDVYASLYFPDSRVPFYRASITGDQLIIEFAFVPSQIDIWNMVDLALSHFGMKGHEPKEAATGHKQTYAKIASISDRARKKFMIWATDNHNVYSLGRFATWRPGLLMDDVVHDVRVIQSLVENGTYSHRTK